MTDLRMYVYIISYSFVRSFDRFAKENMTFFRLNSLSTHVFLPLGKKSKNASLAGLETLNEDSRNKTKSSLNTYQVPGTYIIRIYNKRFVRSFVRLAKTKRKNDEFSTPVFRLIFFFVFSTKKPIPAGLEKLMIDEKKKKHDYV